MNISIYSKPYQVTQSLTQLTEILYLNANDTLENQTESGAEPIAAANCSDNQGPRSRWIVVKQGCSWPW